MEVLAYDAGANSYDLSGVGPDTGAKKRGAAAAQVSLEIATEMPEAAESQTAALGDQQLAVGSQGSEDAAPATEPADAMATFAAFANHTAEFLLCTKTGRFRTWGYFRDQFLSTGERYMLQTSPSLGCLDIIRSSAGTHGHGEARGHAPARENAKTGRSSNVALLESFYLQTVFALGRAFK